ncbi:MAG: hypothetical protein WCB11_30585 [Terriglobales bacterium]|jgi:hypothetical protein
MPTTHVILSARPVTLTTRDVILSVAKDPWICTAAIHVITLNLSSIQICHPERSQTIRNANRSAESKNPYPRGIIKSAIHRTKSCPT